MDFLLNLQRLFSSTPFSLSLSLSVNDGVFLLLTHGGEIEGPVEYTEVHRLCTGVFMFNEPTIKDCSGH